MSGGYFDDKNYVMLDIADSIQNIVDNNEDESLNEWGVKRGRFFSQETMDYLVVTVSMLRGAAILTNRIDYLLEGDDSEENFLQRIKEEMSKV